MKRILMTLITGLLLAASLSAQCFNLDEVCSAKASFSIDYATVNASEVFVQPTQMKAFVGKDGKMSGAGPACLNFFVGFGLGSWLQGDMVGGIVGSAGDAVGVGLEVYGVVQAVSIYKLLMRISSGNITDSDLKALGITNVNADSAESEIQSALMTAIVKPAAFIGIGSLISLGTHIFGIIKANTYAADYNGKVAVAPVATAEGVGFETTVRF